MTPAQHQPPTVTLSRDQYPVPYDDRDGNTWWPYATTTGRIVWHNNALTPPQGLGLSYNELTTQWGPLTAKIHNEEAMRDPGSSYRVSGPVASASVSVALTGRLR